MGPSGLFIGPSGFSFMGSSGFIGGLSWSSGSGNGPGPLGSSGGGSSGFIVGLSGSSGPSSGPSVPSAPLPSDGEARIVPVPLPLFIITLGSLLDIDTEKDSSCSPVVLAKIDTPILTDV